MIESTEKWHASIAFKAVVIAVLTILMLWPLARVASLVDERQALEHQANETIAAGFGGSQVLGAPIITVDTQARTLIVDPTTKLTRDAWNKGAPLHLLADEVQVSNEVSVRVRSKGIYSVPVYVSTVVITGVFKPEAMARLLLSNADTQVLSARAVFQLPLSGIKYLRALTLFEVDGQSLHAESGEIAGFAALTAPIDLRSTDGSHPLSFRLEFQIAGSESLHFLPLGSHTSVTARVLWPHPDFDGAFLPVSHEFQANAYSATWEILELNREIPPVWSGDLVTHSSLMATAFGIQLFQPSNIYTQNYRAVRYGILFIAITFACFFAWEHLGARLRLHPMQYLLVGLSLATFYLLLLALSEHLGFAASYALAAAALVALITTYINGATDNHRAALTMGAGLAACYGALYVILLSEDYALLFGSLLLFVILAGLMLATRRLDWSRVRREG